MRSAAQGATPEGEAAGAAGEIAVVGAGIGGLTLALALERRGVPVTLYEAAPRLREAGTGIWIPPNAMQILDRLEISGVVASEGMPIRRMEIRTRRSRLLRSVDLEAVGRSLGTTTVSIHRGRLHRILSEKIPPGRLRTGHRCVGLVEERGSGLLELHFEGGFRARARLVVGADGIRSVVRKFVDPYTSVRSSGQVAIRGIAPTPLPDSHRGVSGEFWGPGHRFGFSAIGPEETYWWCAYDVDGHAAGFSGHPLAGARALGDAFPEPIPRLLEVTMPDGVISTPLEDLPSLRTWHRRRAVLLGDAAHAMTPNLGQGGAQAMEDAWVLGELLASDPDIASPLLDTYEESRRVRAERMATLSRWTGRLAQIANPLGRALRNTLLRRLPQRLEDQQAEALYALSLP